MNKLTVALAYAFAAGAEIFASEFRKRFEAAADAQPSPAPEQPASPSKVEVLREARRSSTKPTVEVAKTQVPEAVVQQPVSAAVPEKTPEPAALEPEPENDAPKVTSEDVLAAARKLLDTGEAGGKKFQDILASFNVKKRSELTDDQLAPALEAIKAAVAEANDPTA